MPNSEKNNFHVKSVAFIDYKPAELRTNKEWIIVYYAKNPATKDLERFRLRAPTLKDKSERLKHAKKIVTEINLKLASGWSPFLEESGKNYKSLESAVSDFQKYISKQVQSEVLRPDTLRSYNSNLNLMNKFVAEKKKIIFALEINRVFCTEYLDWIYMERNSSARTRNNHLAFLKLFCTHLVNRGVLKENPAFSLTAMLAPKKKREYIPAPIRKKIIQKLLTNDDAFDIVCLITYFCFIRSTELIKLRVGMVDLNKNSIYLSSEISKNKKSEFVTIPQQFIEPLKKHITKANKEDFLFSSEKFRPGTKQMNIRKIQTGWDKLRVALKLPSKYQFYSLKDSGITDLLLSGVPAITVRDQARHYDIKITELYTPRNMGCNETIRNAGVNF